jgi:hypothetical protein
MAMPAHFDETWRDVTQGAQALARKLRRHQPGDRPMSPIPASGPRS